MALTSVGAATRPAGITERPDYAYAPPPAFFAEGPPLAADVYDVRQFGAVADANVDSRAMIQAAIDAAHAAGGGIVHVPAGTWGIGANPDATGSLELKDNVFLKGDGMGQTVLRLMDGTSGVVTGMVRSDPGVIVENWGVADLTLDGNKANASAQVDGFYSGPKPGLDVADADVYVLRLEVHDVSRYGIDPHEQTVRLSVRDSVSHDNGLDGFTVDFVSESEFVGNRSYDNGRHGFNFVTSSHDLLVADNIAANNAGNGFVVQRGSEDITPSHDIAIIGGASYGNGGDGVLVQFATNVTVEGMSVQGNAQSGIRLLGASHTTVKGNQVADNSQTGADAYSEIQITDYADSVTDRVFASAANLVSDNEITSTAAIPSRYGIEERPGEVYDNVYRGNTVEGPTRGAMALNGDGGLDVKIGTAGDDEMVGFSTGDWMSGRGGNDVMRGNLGRDQMDGGGGNDVLSGNGGHDAMRGRSGDDSMVGGTGHDHMRGDRGADHISGNSGNDRLWGGDDNDSLRGCDGNDVLSGGSGDDWLNGGSGDDIIWGDAGDDLINGGSGFDCLTYVRATEGVVVDLADRTGTGFGTDAIYGIEKIVGSAHGDVVKGSNTAEVFEGGDGDDVLAGRSGADTLTGGAGNDTFVWEQTSEIVRQDIHQGVDLVTDFSAGDILDLSGLLTGQSVEAVRDVLTLTATQTGTTVAVRIDGGFQDVVILDGAFDLDAAAMVEAGLLVI